MDCYTKQWCPGYKTGTGSTGWETAMGLDMSASPGTVIRPDMPLGSGPAKSADTAASPILMRQQGMSAGPCPWMPPKKTKCSDTKGESETAPVCMICPEMPVCPMPPKCPEKVKEAVTMKCPEMPMCPMPPKCPEKVRESMTMKCPEMPVCPMPVKCPEKVKEAMPVKCPEMPAYKAPVRCPGRPSPAENIDLFPVGMTYVPWQRWQQVYSVEVAIDVGTIFPDLNKPFIMGGCR